MNSVSAAAVDTAATHINRSSELQRSLSRALSVLSRLPFFAIAFPFVVLARIIRPRLLLRWEAIYSSRIGHFAANPEMHLCEMDAGINLPRVRRRDLFYFTGPVANRQLARMWRRVLRIRPRMILATVAAVNRRLPGGAMHEVGTNTQRDRDVHNLLDRIPPHLCFTAEEEARGKAELESMGVPAGSPFVCLVVRDGAYLERVLKQDTSYHSYRDTDIRNYLLAMEELARRGFFVFRMGAIVEQALGSTHPKVIDYATNGMRSDFMDIFLGAKCAFCVTVGTGMDSIPFIFRRPMAFVNVVPIGNLPTYSEKFLLLSKHHVREADGRELALREIFSVGAGFCLRTEDYESHGVRLVENTPVEIRDLAIEMAERLEGSWRPSAEDEQLQKRFWEIFPADSVDLTEGRPLHGQIRARFGTAFLRNNRWWLE